MGSMVRQERSFRFIEEFQEDAKKAYAPGPEGGKVFTSFGLGFDESDEVVRLYWTATFDGVQRDFTSDSFPIFFDPEQDEEDCIERIMDVFEMDRETAVNRLAEASLVSNPEELKRCWGHFTEEYFEIQFLDRPGIASDDGAAIEAHRKECGCPWPETDFQARLCSYIWDTGCTNDSDHSPKWSIPGADALRKKFREFYEYAKDRSNWVKNYQGVGIRLLEAKKALDDACRIAPPAAVPGLMGLVDKTDRMHRLVVDMEETIRSGRNKPEVLFSYGSEWDECTKCHKGLRISEAYIAPTTRPYHKECAPKK
jgi:hypothetical protein